MSVSKYCFLLPAYKVSFFKEALGSILQQTYRSFEVVVSDDCSPDDLKTIVDEFDDPRVSYVRNENNIGGKDLVAQWNNCLRLTESEYVIMASDDDVYMPSFLEEIDKLVSKYPDVDIFRARTQRIDKDGDLLHSDPQLTEEYLSFEDCVRMFAEETIMSGVPQYVYNRAGLLAIGGFHYCPAAWFSDNMVAMALSKNGIAISKNILFLFRTSGMNISSTNSRILIAQKTASVKHFQEFVQTLSQDMPDKEEIQLNFKEHTRRITMDCIANQGFRDFLFGLKCCAKSGSSWLSMEWRMKKLVGYLLRKIGIIKIAI